MRQTVVFVALGAATLVLALWALGVFEPKPPPEAPPTPPAVPAPPETPRDLAVAEPPEEPPADPVSLPSRVRVLTLGNGLNSFPQWFYQSWEDDPRIEFQAWWANPHGAQPPHSPSLPALAAPPSPDELADVAVLILDDVDPKVVPDAFWRRVAERVRSGALGLLIRPGAVNGMALASHESLKPLLPVEPRPVEGIQPGNLVAGVFPEERRFTVTRDGTSHPLSRLVRWPGWSAKKWEGLAAGPKPWGTRFVHPTGDLRPGAVSLLTVKGHRAEDMPALVASDPARGRVLWVGFHDVGYSAYRDGSRSADAIRALSVAWLSWLSGASA